MVLGAILVAPLQSHAKLKIKRHTHVAKADKPQVGIASFYGGKFHGRRTANGEIFNKNGLTAAHKTLPFGTMVKVTNLINDKTILVRINDRGPFVHGRMIDLTIAAAKKIGLVGRGTGKVKVEVV